MAHIEIQIANDPLMQALQQMLMPRLYANCYVIPVQGLVLDHLAVGTIGPCDPNEGSLTVPVRIGVSLVSVDAVINANGGAAKPSNVPQITANLVLTVSGTVLTVAYDKILHDTDYQSLKDIVALSFEAGGEAPDLAQTDAQALFDQWESQVKSNIGDSPLLQYDFGPSLPPEFSALRFGRSDLSADSGRIAIRLEVGAANSDGDWTSFLSPKGALVDRLQGQHWGMFISSDSVVQIANQALAQAVYSVGGKVESSAWAPQGQVATVDSAASITFHAHAEVWPGITIFDGDVTVSLDTTTTFTMEPSLVGVMRTDISYNIQAQGGLDADIANALDLANRFAAGNDVAVPPYYTKVADREFFRDTSIPPQVLRDDLTGQPILTLRAKTLIGLSDGMSIAGTADVVLGLAVPDCNVQATPFVLQLVTDCLELQGGGHHPSPTELTVSAVASFSVFESSSTGELPLVIGEFQLVGSKPADDPPSFPPDPDYQFTPFLPAAPQQVGTEATFQVSIPAAKIGSGYKNDPYPCQLLVLTNGGARYLTLGQIPIPIIDPVTKRILNAHVVYIPDCPPASIVPWAVMMGIFNPHWLVDPSPEGEVARQQIAESLVNVLTTGQVGQATPIVVNGTQVGTVSVGTMGAGQSEGAAGASTAAQSATRVVTELFQSAARLQPPSFPQGAGGSAGL